MLRTPRRDLLARLRRRQALRLAAAGGSSLLVAELGALLPAFLRPGRADPFGGKVSAGPLDEVVAHFARSADEPLLVTQGRYYLLRAPDGLLAVFRRCTHLGCVYRWVPAEDRFHCPCHQSTFDKRTGVVLGGPATRPLDLFPIAIEEGEVVVETDPRPGHLITRGGYDEAQALPIG